MSDCTTKQFLGQLRQFGFILTGDEETADWALAEALSNARYHLTEADAFPCLRSWLFANLLSALDTCELSPAPGHSAHSWWISLLQMPYDQRTVLVLVDGYKFDLATAALIVRTRRTKAEQTLSRARVAFLNLTRGA